DDILGSPFEGTDDVVARGVHYAVDNGAKVLNMSIGRSGAPSPLLQEAIIYATSWCVCVDRGRKRLRTRQSDGVACGVCELHPGCGGGWRHGSRSPTRLLFVHGAVCRAGRAWREPADRWNDGGYRAADLRFRVRRYVRQRPGTLRAPAIRHLLVSISAGNVDVHAPRGGVRGALDAAGDRLARGCRSRNGTVCDRPWPPGG